MTCNIEQRLFSLTTLWCKRISYQTFRNSKEKESFSYQSRIKRQSCSNVFCSSCLKRQIQSGFVHITDLADLQSLHTHTQNSIIGSQKSVVNIHHDSTCMLNPVTVALVDFFQTGQLCFHFQFLLFGFLHSMLRLISLKKLRICECPLHDYVKTLGSEGTAQTQRNKSIKIMFDK